MVEELRKEPVEILLIEDSEEDIELTKEALVESRIYSNLNVVMDGAEAIRYLKRKNDFSKRPTPDLILLDLNLPKLDGAEVLTNIKKDDDLKHIPVVVLTTSRAEQDILKSYQLHANCFITKPIDFYDFMDVIKSIEDFWFTIARIPS